MAQKFLLLVGGSGSLGQNVANSFKSSWNIVNIDVHQNPSCSSNILINTTQRPYEYLQRVKKELDGISNQFDSVICVAGGWIQGSIKESDVFEQYKLMSDLNLIPSVLAGHLATKYLVKNGLVVFTGAAGPFKDPTPSMIGYALTQTAVHSLSLNLANQFSLNEETKGNTVVTILPQTIDTPANRKAMPEADISKWNPPDKIAGMLQMWSEGENRPSNGSFAILKTKNGAIVPEFI